MTTFAMKNRKIAATKLIRMPRINYALFAPYLTIVLISTVSAVSLKVNLEQNDLINFQHEKLKLLSTHCPDITLSGKTISSTGSIEADGEHRRKCIYDIHEHVLYQNILREPPKDSSYLRLKK